MKTYLLPSLAVAFGLSTCAVAQGQTNSYQTPAKWSNFNTNTSSHNFYAASAFLDEDAVKDAAKEIAADVAEEAVKEAKVEELPIPAFVPAGETPFPDAPAPQAHSAGCGCNSCDSGSPYAAALAPSNISPWFGGAELLFLNVENNSYGRNLAVGTVNGLPYLNTNDVDPEATAGFSTHFGRYLNCGQSAWDVKYFLFNPDEETAIARPPVPGDFRPAFTDWNNVTVNPGVAGPVYGYYAGATAFRARRDMFFQGLEANMMAFGIMGARRVGVCGSNGLPGRLNKNGYYGGAGGPIARACSGRVQSRLLHGFRWFQLEDEFEYAADIDVNPGYQADDLYYNVDAENNLFGYQAGGYTTYCLHNRLNLGIGGKIGIYGNRAEVRHRLGTETALAYLTATGVDDVLTEDSRTVLSALGEIDLGLGYRVSNAWTVRGGYRLMAACGVATSVDSLASDYSSLAAVGSVSADDCVILHGGYIGMEYNF